MACGLLGSFWFGSFKIHFSKSFEEIHVGEEVQKVKGPATKRKVPAKKNAMKKNIDTEKMSGIAIQFEPDSDMGSNKDKILKLHEEGKSNMAIAKSLGLGIGEVKLIIDLFEAEE